MERQMRACRRSKVSFPCAARAACRELRTRRRTRYGVRREGATCAMAVRTEERRLSDSSYWERVIEPRWFMTASRKQAEQARDWSKSKKLNEAKSAVERLAKRLDR